MLGNKVYIDIDTEINILKYRIEDLEGEYAWWQRQVFHGDNKPAASLDKCVNHMNNILEDIAEYEQLLHHKQEMLDRVEKEMSKYKELDKRVVYMHLIQGKSLKEIAGELGYSHIWIRQVYNRASKTIA